MYIKGSKQLQGHETLCETEKSLDMYETNVHCFLFVFFFKSVYIWPYSPLLCDLYEI